VSRNLITWPLLRTLGLYIGACWVAVEFADWLVGRYAWPDRLVDVALIGLLSFTPTVAMIAWFHGAPGRQQFHPVEKVGIPANVLISGAIIAGLVYGQPQQTLAVDTVTVTDPSGEAITRPLVQPSMSRGVSLFFFDNETDDPQRDWLQYGLTLALSADLQQHPFVKAWTPYSGMNAYGMFQLRKAGYDNGLDVPVALMRNIASLGRMEYFLTGELQTAGDGADGITLITRLYDTDSAQSVLEVSEQVATDDDLLVAIDRTTAAVLGALELPKTDQAPTDLPVADRLTESLSALEGHTLAMNALMLEADNDTALRLWAEAVAEDPTFAVAQVAMGRTLFENGLMLDGGMAVAEALRHDYKLIDKERFVAKGLNYVFRGQRDQELATYKAWTELAPQDPLAFTYLGSTYLYAANDADNALEAFERVYELDPREDWALSKIAYLHEVKHNREAAIEYYTRYHESRPDDASPLNSLGKLHRRSGELDIARQFFARAAIVANGMVAPVLNLADLDVREGRYEAALARLAEAEQIASAPRQHAAVLRGRIAYHAQRGQEQQILALLPTLAAQSEQYESPINMMMSVWIDNIEHYVTAQRVEEGIELLRGFEGGLQPPLNSLVDVGYLRLSLAMRDAEAASAHAEVVDELMKTLSLDYLLYQGAYGHGMISGIRGDLPAAIEQLERALALFQDSVSSLKEESDAWQIMTDLADHYLRNGQDELASERLRDVLAVYPAHVTANLKMAELLHARGKEQDAAAHLATVTAALAEADENYPLRVAARDLTASLGT
jgi:tetratricopeptide (TPR) repeat protein